MRPIHYAEKVHVWKDIWTKPRRTIREYLNHDAYSKLILLLAALDGYVSAIEKAAEKHLGNEHSIGYILGFSLVGFIGGIIYLYFSGFLIRITGKWIGGQGRPEELRAALALSSIPYIGTLAIWIIEILLFGRQLFTEQIVFSSSYFEMTYGVLELMKGILLFWSFFSLLFCLSEVQRFSAWKSFVNLILSILILVVPILFIVWVLSSF